MPGLGPSEVVFRIEKDQTRLVHPSFFMADSGKKSSPKANMIPNIDGILARGLGGETPSMENTIYKRYPQASDLPQGTATRSRSSTSIESTLGHVPFFVLKSLLVQIIKKEASIFAATCLPMAK